VDAKGSPGVRLRTVPTMVTGSGLPATSRRAHDVLRLLAHVSMRAPPFERRVGVDRQAEVAAGRAGMRGVRAHDPLSPNAPGVEADRWQNPHPLSGGELAATVFVLGPGLPATAVSALLAAYFILRPAGSPLGSPVELLGSSFSGDRSTPARRGG